MAAEVAAAAGDPLPGAVASLLERLAAGDAPGAAACFAPEGFYAFPGDPAEERGARAVGAGALLATTIADDPTLGRPHPVRVCVVEGSSCLIEGQVELEEGGPLSFASSFQLDAEGMISRCLTFRCQQVGEVGTAAADVTPGDARAQVDGYFDELEAGRFAAAVAYFGDGCLYSHPPYKPGLERVAFRGRDSLQAGFEHRGKLAKRHFLLAEGQRGPHLLLEGAVWLEGTAEGRDASFMSSVTLAPDGRIGRYVAFVCEPAVPRRDPA